LKKKDGSVRVHRITTNKKNKKKIRESVPDRREKKNTVRVYRCMKKKKKTSE